MSFPAPGVVAALGPRDGVGIFAGHSRLMQVATATRRLSVARPATACPGPPAPRWPARRWLSPSRLGYGVVKRGRPAVSPPVVIPLPALPRPAPSSVGRRCSRRGCAAPLRLLALAVAAAASRARLCCALDSAEACPALPAFLPEAAAGIQPALGLRCAALLKGVGPGGELCVRVRVRVPEAGAAAPSGLPVSVGVHGLQWQVISSSCV